MTIQPYHREFINMLSSRTALSSPVSVIAVPRRDPGKSVAFRKPQALGKTEVGTFTRHSAKRSFTNYRPPLIIIDDFAKE